MGRSRNRGGDRRRNRPGPLERVIPCRDEVRQRGVCARASSFVCVSSPGGDMYTSCDRQLRVRRAMIHDARTILVLLDLLLCRPEVDLIPSVHRGATRTGHLHLNELLVLEGAQEGRSPTRADLQLDVLPGDKSEDLVSQLVCLPALLRLDRVLRKSAANTHSSQRRTHGVVLRA